MLENFTVEDLSLMDKVFKFEYDNRRFAVQDHYICEQLNITNKDLVYANRQLVKVLVPLELCRINEYASGRFNYMEFYERECERFFADGGFTGLAIREKEERNAPLPIFHNTGTIIGGDVSHSLLSTHSPTNPIKYNTAPTKTTTSQILKRVSAVITLLGLIVGLITKLLGLWHFN